MRDYDMSGVPDMDFLTLLTDEQLQDYLAPYGQQNAVLEQQLADAQGLQQPGRRYSTWGGAALGGLGDVLRNVAGVRNENTLRDKQQTLLGQQQRSAGDVLGAYRDWGSIPELLRRPTAREQAATPLASFGPQMPLGPWGGY